jgi:hypothetical protein
MAKGDRIKARVTARIKESSHSLTLHYPPKRVGATGTGPMTRPANPLTGIVAAPSIDPTTPDPERDPVSMPCLWLDAITVALQGRNQWNHLLIGMVPGATAIARVLIEDAALDADAPEGGTEFERCSYVEHAGKRYRVLEVKPVGAGFYDPYTYYVWLVGAVKE